MSSSKTANLPRSNYARNLLDFPEFVFADHAAFQFPGKWRDYFHDRIGSTYNDRLICEIGCSDAAYLSRIAAKFPNTGFVGLDWKCKPIYDGARQIADSGIRNITLVRGRGQDLSHVFGSRELDEIWVFHPDPYDGRAGAPTSSYLQNMGALYEPRILENRLIGESFFLDAHSLLRNDASLLAIKTDHPGYYQSMLGLFGIAEPTWFQSARDGIATRPRVQAKDLLPMKSIALLSETIRNRLSVTMRSADFWSDPATLLHTVDRCFSGETTAFESRFIKKRFPIYYFEVRGSQNSLR